MFICRGVFRHLPNIYDGVFFEKGLFLEANKWVIYKSYFRKLFSYLKYASDFGMSANGCFLDYTYHLHRLKNGIIWTNQKSGKNDLLTITLQTSIFAVEDPKQLLNNWAIYFNSFEWD